MRFNISAIVVAVAASSGVMAAPFAGPEANAQSNALERRAGPSAAVVEPLKWTSKQVLPNVFTAFATTLSMLRLWSTNLGPKEIDSDSEYIEPGYQQNYQPGPGVDQLQPVPAQ